MQEGRGYSDMLSALNAITAQPQGSLEQQDTQTVAPTSEELQQDDVVHGPENDLRALLQKEAVSPAGAQDGAAAALSLFSDSEDGSFVLDSYGSP